MEKIHKCNTFPTSGCEENLILAQLILLANDVNSKLTEASTALDEMQTAFQQMCIDTGLGFERIGEHTGVIIENDEDCCEGINDLLEQLGDIIENMVIGEAIPVVSTTVLNCELEGEIVCNVI